MGTMQLLLLTAGLGLLSVMQAESPPLTPALANEVTGLGEGVGQGLRFLGSGASMAENFGTTDWSHE